jgi:hypothetical protein
MILQSVYLQDQQVLGMGSNSEVPVHTHALRGGGRTWLCVSQELLNHFPLPTLVLTGTQGPFNHPVSLIYFPLLQAYKLEHFAEDLKQT